MESLLIPFLHEHPLTLITDSERHETIRTMLLICHGCGKPVSSEPSYVCHRCEDFMIHQKCAELPPEIKHPLHARHALTLLAKPPYETSCSCDACGRAWRNFTYHCSSCNFDLDILCAFRDSDQFLDGEQPQSQTLVEMPAASTSEYSSGHENENGLTLKNILQQEEDQLNHHHFSHKHPLTLLIDAQDDDDQEETEESIICCGCRKPARSSSGSEPTYCCRECNIFLHKRCADLPREIEHPLHSKDHHPLVLLAKPPYGSGSCRCQVCRKPWSGFVYHCSSCEFDIDILCAFPVGELIRMIPTHNHPVRLVQRPASFKCNACDVRGSDDHSYLCTVPSCGFWIHKGCASFPLRFKYLYHHHPLCLATSLPTEFHKRGFSCKICRKELRPSLWLYYCGQCRYFVHFNCVAHKVAGYARAIHLPQKHLVESTFGSESRVRRLKLPEKEVEIQSHKHSLVLYEPYRNTDVEDEDEDEEQVEEIICDGCVESIKNRSYYKCRHDQCGFFLHVTCANLPKHCPNPGHIGCSSDDQSRLKLYFPQIQNPWEVVECKLCNSFCSGYSYKCDKCNFCFDVKCSCLMRTIKHNGHRHWLFLEWVSTPFICNGCGEYKNGPYFSCSPCNYKLGYECALLPATAKHRWDKHELTLSFPPFKNINLDDFLCEVCEENIDPTQCWIYRCNECDQSFHPRCIPTLGASRNIKFGRTLAIQHHPHPLTHIPDGNLTSRCDKCHKLLYCKRAFECISCRFYLCPDCIAKQPPYVCIK